MTVQSGGRYILNNGLALVLAGLIFGLIVPNTPYPRLALGAHIQFETNGLLFIALGVLLLKLPNNVGQKSIWVMVLSVLLTWLMALSEVVNGWWGTAQMLPIAASQAGATGGKAWQEIVLKVTHIGGALCLIVAWGLLFIGFVKPDTTGKGND